MSLREEVELRHASVEDTVPVAATLAAAFQDDPVMRWWIADDAARAAVVPRFFEFALEHQYARHEEIYIAGEDGGAAAWCPPNEWRLPEEEFAALAPGYFEAIGEEYFERGAMIVGLVEERHPEMPHWYLPFIGVRPDRQGRGIGSALLASMTTRLDRDGLPAYLEASSERNRALYLRHGFEVTGDLTLPDGPTMWLMWRDPRDPS
jgi:ribosomal protein S18 acetylase RimI-like enzyme